MFPKRVKQFDRSQKIDGRDEPGHSALFDAVRKRIARIRAV
jgi:hypothetical protein